MKSKKIKESEKKIFNQGYHKRDILPDKKLLDFLFSIRDVWIQDKIDRFPKGISVLDVGCGEGQSSIEFAKKGFQVTGIDISNKRIEKAIRKAEKESLTINFLVGDFEITEFQNNFFDLIYCKAILHHMPNISQDLDQMNIILKKGGSLIITEPGLLNPFAFIRRRLFPTSIHTPDEHPFVPYKLRKIIKYKFSKIEIEYFFIFSLLALILGKLFGKNLGKGLLKLLIPFDFLLTRIPLVREFCWIINLHVIK
jgi:ubiquinone/menaquinone biosynthesis C-methylase UbiE